MSPLTRGLLEKAVLCFRCGEDPMGSLSLDAAMTELCVLAVDDDQVMRGLEITVDAHNKLDTLRCADVIEHRLLGAP